ncbi:MAG TPA: DUF1963 domain-containing protein, partial [Mycobacterium sp.]|nr:DUF1963 domain-containing protein [Mycobacterium sp.]
MLTHSEIRALTDDLGLGHLAEGLIEALRPVYRLELASNGGAVRIGGAPELIEGEQWPRNARGVALTFIGQLDTSRVPPHPAADASVASWRGVQ